MNKNIIYTIIALCCLVGLIVALINSAPKITIKAEISTDPNYIYIKNVNDFEWQAPSIIIRDFIYVSPVNIEKQYTLVLNYSQLYNKNGVGFNQVKSEYGSYLIGVSCPNKNIYYQQIINNED